MFLRTDGGLSAVGVRGEQLRHHGSIELVAIIRQTDVILLIDSLQLRMETTNGHIHEAVGLNLCPVINLVRGDILHVAGHIV